MEANSGLTTQEVAQVLNISKNTVYELIKRGELSSYRVGRKVRIDEIDIEKYKNKSRTNIKTSSINVEQINVEKINNPIITSLNTKKDLPGSSYKSDFIICGQDILLDVLTRHLEQHPNGLQALRRYIGSYNGLVELYRGNINIATAHLWDCDTGVYNIPYVRRILPGVPCIIIHLVCRMQGFYVAKGNPKSITTWKDLTRSDVLMINRERGCGVRVLIDEKLCKLGIPWQSINGYESEALSHLAVASTVARGDADVAVGNEKAAQQVENIQFVPMQKERYDLIIKKDDINKPPFQAILEIINSKEFKEELRGIGGYDLTDTGKIVEQP
ncbi:helix-turn-helix transcriptional regulator [Clostridium estertheticum]|uniref:Helix-turn-helix transcriptional regulator n=1 Tax=Clostridium estertheticum TaxID=238834 RepID=A0AA47EMI0_9CLOT|nr:helix-turn-helix transcriptional regulator [Clostridium estertheticum]MBU3154061.1 helix-turn-helix transcriptional regulator [Clostridium estertheticum]MBU3199779.1 helix-turn-helix transcriptional regulator [Clostridium estertheticum]WAG62922.1 helix-turn-helix transcriptional regulator [Clostridium estertheticum]WAG67569.1 helix-turn-helix transcriptional regulator [Clostridium estertheticum]